MALWRLTPVAEAHDGRWQDRRIWREVITLRPPAEANKRQELLAHSVTFCIEEYYRQS